MTRSELISKLAAHFHQLTVKDAEASVSVILTAIAEKLATEGGRVEIRGFGSFKVNYRPPRPGRNPRTAVTVSIPAKHLPHFKAGRELRERVAASAAGTKRSVSSKVKELALESG
jgi:integration host factor subunit beta